MHRIIFIFSLILYLSFVGVLKTKAQNIPYLERMVTLDMINQPLSEIFIAISKQTSVIFSYSGLNDKQLISERANKRPLRIVLNDLLKNEPCRYKMKGKYVILHCNFSEIKNKEPEYYPAEFSGYIYNGMDSSIIENASLYIRQSKQSTLSNEYGYFILFSAGSEGKVTLSIAKQNYRDTSLTLDKKDNHPIFLYLTPLPKKPEVKVVVLDSNKSVQNKLDTTITHKDTVIKKKTFATYLNIVSQFLKSNANFKNIKDTLFSDFSISLIPPLSSNKLLSVNTMNKYSLNLIAGYSKGIGIMEIGGVLNIDNGDVKYFQTAGLINTVTGNFSGTQFAGLINNNGKKTIGFQAAGLINITNSMQGVQATGLLNVAGNVKGAQFAGLINVANDLKGIQVAGLINAANHVRGAQVAGFMNVAKNMKGLQLSVMNVADTCNGIPIGLFSFVSHGYHKIEIAQDELQFTTLAFRTGVDKFHNIFFAGLNFVDYPNLWTYGYGLGSSFAMSRKLYLDMDLTAQQIQPIHTSNHALNEINKLFVGLEFRMIKKISLAAGPTFNAMVSDNSLPEYISLENTLFSTSIFKHTFPFTRINMWIGAKVSLKFF